MKVIPEDLSTSVYIIDDHFISTQYKYNRGFVALFTLCFKINSFNTFYYAHPVWFLPSQVMT